MTGKKHDGGKPRWDLLPWRQVAAVVEVITFGATKYGERNWQELKNARARYFAALHRHVSAWESGERLDKETGLPHLAHATTNALFLMWFDWKEGSS